MSLPLILLGMLSQPASGYDLKREFDEGARHYWAAELSQIYPALQKLEAGGMITSTSVKSESGPNRRVYERTASGHEELTTWLREGPVMGATRLAYLAQIEFLHELGSLDESAAFVSTIRAHFASLHAYLLAAQEELGRTETGELSAKGFHEELTLRLGVMTLEARIAWCDEAQKRITSRPSSGPP